MNKKATVSMMKNELVSKKVVNPIIKRDSGKSEDYTYNILASIGEDSIVCAYLKREKLSIVSSKDDKLLRLVNPKNASSSKWKLIH